MSDAINTHISRTLKGYAAYPQGHGPFPGIVVIMEAYGITGHIRGVCERLANAGFVALAPDIFHGEVISYTDVEKVMAKIPTLRDEPIIDEIGQSLDWLAAHKNVESKRLGIIGFCMGGRFAFLANCRFPQHLRAAVGMYGGGIAPNGQDRFGRIPPITEADRMQAPIFLGYGADDQGIPPAEHAHIAETLSAAKKRYSLAVYPGAGHAFLCEERANYAPKAAEQAWPEIIAFLQANLAID
ncbi:MAG TPA: dienelactone hydrolase family protein [Gammaproteobacteria bacterium]|nr:dienelactone hydrolase family protein [Gammaproteobacteria bacterium]